MLLIQMFTIDLHSDSVSRIFLNVLTIMYEFFIERLLNKMLVNSIDYPHSSFG